MIVLRIAFHAFGLFLALSALTACPRTAHALYMPQEFNLTAARNETDSRLAHAAAATYPGVNGTDAAAAAAAGADDAALVPRDVWSPEIFSPNARDVWTAGSTVAVRWDTADPPGEVTSYAGRVLLGWEEGGDGDEHVCAEHPLAEGFNLTQGSVKVKVPMC